MLKNKSTLASQNISQSETNVYIIIAKSYCVLYLLPWTAGPTITVDRRSDGYNMKAQHNCYVSKIPIPRQPPYILFPNSYILFPISFFLFANTPIGVNPNIGVLALKKQ